MEFVLVILISVAVSVAIGIVCSSAASNKGWRTDIWFLLGFLFNLIALIIIPVLPRKN